MITPGINTLRRRTKELLASAEREKKHNLSSAALLLFYGAECGLKAVYMQQYQLKDTNDTRGRAKPARSFSHNLLELIQAVNVSPRSIPNTPTLIRSRDREVIHVKLLHEAWRYGENVEDAEAVYSWLLAVMEWCRKNL